VVPGPDHETVGVGAGGVTYVGRADEGIGPYEHNTTPVGADSISARTLEGSTHDGN